MGKSLRACMAGISLSTQSKRLGGGWSLGFTIQVQGPASGAGGPAAVPLGGRALNHRGTSLGPPGHSLSD